MHWAKWPIQPLIAYLWGTDINPTTQKITILTLLTIKSNHKFLVWATPTPVSPVARDHGLWFGINNIFGEMNINTYYHMGTSCLFLMIKLPGIFISEMMCVIFYQIIDSIMALFRVDFCGRGELADRQQKLAQMLSRLQKLSEGELHHSIFLWASFTASNLHRLLFSGSP